MTIYLAQLLTHLKLAFDPNETIWLRDDDCYKNFYKAYLSEQGQLRIFETKGSATDRKVTNKELSPSELLELFKTSKAGGLHYCIGSPQEYPLKGYSKGSRDLGMELDWGSPEEQAQQYQFLEDLGLKLTLVHSGNKSLHGHVFLDNPIPVEQWTYLGRLLALLVHGDPNISQEQRSMRLAGAYRWQKLDYLPDDYQREQGKPQELIRVGERISLNTLLAGLEEGFKAKGLPLLESISDERWGKIAKALCKPEATSYEERQAELERILGMTEEEISPPVRPISEQARQQYRALASRPSSHIPHITDFLSRENLALLAGVDSARNATSCRILADLLGIEATLQRSGIHFNGDAYSEFIGFCERCSASKDWNIRAWKSTFRSYSKKTFSPAITEDGVIKRLHWLRGYSDNEYKKITKKISQKLSQEEKKLAKEEKKAQTLPLINSYLEAQSLAQFSPTIINSRYFPSDYQFPPEANLIAIKGMQGTGKTQSLTSMVSKAQGEGQRIIILTHRIQLAISICDRFGIYHIDEITQKEDWQIAQVGLCIDSLHEKSRAKISDATFCNALVIIDECDQSFTHLFHSETLSKSANRVGVMTMFEEGIQNCFASEEGKVILLSADLSPKEINFIKGLARSPEDVKLFCLENVYQPIAQANRKIYTCEKQEELITILLNKLEKGEKALVHLGSQKEKYSYSTSTLQAYIKKRFPHLKILRIDAETLTDRFNPAYKCIGNINNILTNHDLVLASPSIETGVSIDIKEHFDSVFVLANGTQSVDSVCQSLERLREDVPRYIFIKEVSCQKIGNGGTSEDDFKKYTDNKQTKSLEDSMLASGYSSVGFHYKESWVKYAIDQNFGYKNYKQLILAKLSAKGYEIIPYACPILEENLKETKSQTKGTSKELYQKRIERIASLPNPEDDEYKALRDKSSRTKEEAESFLVGQIHRAYLVPEEESVTSQLVEEHENGLYSKLELRYFLSEGKEFLDAKEKEKIAGAVYNKKYFKPDLIASSKAGAVETLGKHLPYLLDTNKIHRQSTLKDWANAVISDRDALKNHLKLNITPEANYPNIKVAQLLLDKVGLVLTQVGEEKISEATGTDGKVKRKTIRLYQLLPETIEKDKYVLDRWFKKDKAKAEAREVEEITKPLGQASLTPIPLVKNQLGQRLEESPKASPSVTTSSIATSNDIDTVPVKPNIYNSLNISTGTKTQDELLRDLNTSNVGSILPHLLKDKNTKDLAWLGEKVAQLNPTEKLASLYRAIAETLQGKTLGILDKYGLTIIQLMDLGAVKLSDSQTFKISELVA